MHKGRLVLTEEKTIQGKKEAVGTALATFETAKKFTIKDLDIAIQMGQAKVVSDEEAPAKGKGNK